jgi:ribose/xylose/arabinose/galactoside ABC-type transport system permease subunit
MSRSMRPLMATAVIFIIAYALSVMQFPGMFSTRVLGNFLTDNAFLGIAAVGMTFVILSGGIDLSVGAVIGFTGVLVAVLIAWAGWHPLAAFAASLAVAAAFGGLMGLTIHYLQVPSFIVSLAGMFLARGGASVITQDSIPVTHEFYQWISSLIIRLPGGGRLSAIGLLMVAVFIVGALVAHRTKFGLWACPWRKQRWAFICSRACWRHWRASCFPSILPQAIRWRQWALSSMRLARWSSGAHYSPEAMDLCWAPSLVLCFWA